VFPFGKLVDSRDIINTVPVVPLSSPLLFLKNRLCSAKFLVDTGASVSVFPHLPCSPSASGSGIQLKTTNGSPMNTYNFRCMALQFGSRRFEWSFVLANVSMSLLGSYFLCCNHLLVDIAGSCLLDSYTLESIPAILSSSSNSSSDLYTALLSTPEEFRYLLSEYPDKVFYHRSKAFSPPY